MRRAMSFLRLHPKELVRLIQRFIFFQREHAGFRLPVRGTDWGFAPTPLRQSCLMTAKCHPIFSLLMMAAAFR